jgi:hypothetical protein
MAETPSNPPRLAENITPKGIKVGFLRVSDARDASSAAYVEIIAGTGAPSGGYGRDSSATMLYLREDASGPTDAVYITHNGGTTWNALVNAIADAELAAIAGLTSAADKLPYFTGSGTASLADFTAAGRALVDDANAAAQRTTLGLVIGTDVQAHDAELDALAGLASAANKRPRFTGSGTAELVDDIDAPLALGGSTAAAGSTNADAAALPAGTGRVYPTTGADDTKGVIVHASDKVTGRMIFIGNGVANKILKVYPPAGGSINGGAANAAFGSASGKGVVLVCLDSAANTWLGW